MHAVIDNFSGRILAWRVAERLEVASTVAVLRKAARSAVSANNNIPALVAHAGVENVNTDVDGLIQSGLLRRVVALKDVMFSNTMIEAWWRTSKYQ